MSIMERLSKEVPKRSAAYEHNPQYQATLQFMEEIEEAKRLGYSWWQVGKAVEEELRSTGVWQESWRFHDTEKFFNQIKKARMA